MAIENAMHKYGIEMNTAKEREHVSRSVIRQKTRESLRLLKKPTQPYRSVAVCTAFMFLIIFENTLVLLTFSLCHLLQYG